MITTRPLSSSLARPLSRLLVWLDNLYATLLVDPAGDDNSVLYTAKASGSAGELVSVAYDTPATQATTDVDVTGDAITVTPGTKARMVVTGTLTMDGNPVIFPTLLYSGVTNGHAAYSDDGNSSGSSYWAIWSTFFGRMMLVQASPYCQWASDTTDVAYPDLSAGWGGTGSTIGIAGTPTVTAGISSAAQVIAAVNASTPAAALVLASESGPSTGPVAAVAADFLTLVPDGALTLGGEALTLDGEILTLE
jgi:hypothetical protein